MNDGVSYAYKMGIVYIYYLYGPPDFNAGLPLGRQAWDAGPPQVWTVADFNSHATGVSPQPLSGETGGTRILIPGAQQTKYPPGRVCKLIIIQQAEPGYLFFDGSFPISPSVKPGVEFGVGKKSGSFCCH